MAMKPNTIQLYPFSASEVVEALTISVPIALMLTVYWITLTALDPAYLVIQRWAAGRGRI